MSNIKISVIMPVYNSGEYLQTAVESILSQSLREIELILVDDGSTDGSSEHCDEYAHKDQRVVVIHQKNGGICAARNTALKIARGDYIAFSDHDDEYLPGLLENNYKRIERSGVDIIKFGSWAIQIYKGKEFRKDKRTFNKSIYSNKQIKNNFWKLWHSYAFECVWDSLFKSSFLKKNKIEFNTFFKTGSEDYDFFWHCLGQGATLELNDDIYYNHYIRLGFSTSAKFHDYTIKTILERTEILFEYIQTWIPILENDKLGYSYFWLQNTLGSLCHVISHPQCTIKIKNKVQILKNLRNDKFFRPWILQISSFSIAQHYGYKYGILHFAYKYGFYNLCLQLYAIEYRKIMK